MEAKGRILRVNNSKEEKSLFDRHLFRTSAYQTVTQIKTTHCLKALIHWSCRVIMFLLKDEDHGNIDKIQTISLNFLPTLKPTVLLALILIVSPVWGFLPVRAFLFFTEKVPNPIS